MKTYLIATAVMMNTASLQAQPDSLKKSMSVTPLPVLLSDPLLGVGYGALANAGFQTGDEHTTRGSNVQVYAINTTKNQFATQAAYTIFTDKENWMLNGKLGFQDWREQTFGLGTGTSATHHNEQASYKATEFEQRVLKRCGNSNFAGFQYRYFRFRDYSVKRERSGSYAEGGKNDPPSFTSSSLGVHLVHDSRDNMQNAYSGHFTEIAFNPYLTALGSSANWGNIRIDSRRYFSTAKTKGRAVMAVRALYEHAFGNVPYLIMPMSGRYNTTRGYVRGRYRGNTFITAESEYRKHIWKQLGAVLFAGVHTVSEASGFYKRIKSSAGCGVRIMINKSQRTNIRIDYARGRGNNSGLYFQVTEAF